MTHVIPEPYYLILTDSFVVNHTIQTGIFHHILLQTSLTPAIHVLVLRIKKIRSFAEADNEKMVFLWSSILLLFYKLTYCAFTV
jgi:hypothetical protein